MYLFGLMERAARLGGVDNRAGAPLPIAACPAINSVQERRALTELGPRHDLSPVPRNVRDIEQRLLFVGGDNSWYRGVERDLMQLQPDWVCTHVPSCQRALEMLLFDDYDALVLDGRLSAGTELLKSFARQFPKAFCLVRCNVWDRSAVDYWSFLGATPIEEASDGAGLALSLEKTSCLASWMAEPAMQKLLPQLRQLPTMPELHADVMEQLSSPNVPLEKVARLISQEPVMTAKVLQVVNSTLLGLSYQVSDPAEAVLFLGTERTRSLILLAGVFSQFDRARRRTFSPDKIWVHSLQVGWLARRVAIEQTRSSRTAEAAFTAGLLHDIGKLMLAANLPDTYEAIRQAQARKACSPREAELEVLGTTHAELGACLLGSWGLALPILEAIAYHHRPSHSDDTAFSLLTAVHVADVLAQEAGFSSSSSTSVDSASSDYLTRIGLAERMSDWRVACGLPAHSVSPK